MSPFTDAEKLERLQLGRPLLFPAVALNEGPEETAARTVRAEWLEDPSKPVVIANAIITGPVTLASAVLEGAWSITESTFRDAVDFSSATFEKTACFDGCHFLRRVSFRDARLSGDLEWRRVFFAAPADCTDFAVSDSFDARSATFAEVVFDNVRIGASLLLEPARPDAPTYFTGPASFASARVGGLALFSSAQFLEAVTFDDCHIDRGAFFRPDGQTGLQVQFRGPASFVGAVIGGEADFRGAIFRGDAGFEAIHIRGDADFGPDTTGRRVVFLQDARFSQAHIGGRVNFTQADFFAQAIFREATFASGANLDKVGFRQPGDFTGARFSA